MNNDKTPTILAWAEEDRPREKMLIWGKNEITDAELLSIIIGSGTREINAYDLARKILASYDNKISKISRLKSSDLMTFKGIGPARAVNILASLEFGRRANLEEREKIIEVTSSRMCYNLMKTRIGDLPHEEFWIVLLNQSKKLISKERISVGGVSQTVVDPKIVFSKAIEKLACSIILVHNHPSGNLTPSISDINLTKQLCKAGLVLSIEVVDHLILSESGYYSFNDNGIMPRK